MFTTLGHQWTVENRVLFQKHFGNGRNPLFITEERNFNGRLTHVIHTFFGCCISL